MEGAAGIARIAARVGIEKKAQDVVVLDLREIAPRPSVDYFVLMSSVSEPHQRALADHVIEELDRYGIRHWHLEGYPSSGWILIDFSDVVVHIFRPESRGFYSLETLWGDAPGERVEDDAARAAHPDATIPRRKGRRPASRKSTGSSRRPGRPRSPRP